MIFLKDLKIILWIPKFYKLLWQTNFLQLILLPVKNFKCIPRILKQLEACVLFKKNGWFYCCTFLSRPRFRWFVVKVQAKARPILPAGATWRVHLLHFPIPCLLECSQLRGVVFTRLLVAGAGVERRDVNKIVCCLLAGLGPVAISKTGLL